MTAEEEKQLSLHFVKSPPRWPMWPYLPVKKRSSKPGEGPECGTLFARSLDEKQPQPIIFDSIDSKNRTTVIAQYDSLEAMVADGWVVD